jgi:hypothetical protein
LATFYCFHISSSSIKEKCSKVDLRREKAMLETNDERPEVATATNSLGTEVVNPQDQYPEKSERPAVKPAPGRLPARASRR